MLNRRKFLGLGFGALAALVPSSLSAVDYRKTNPKLWDIKNSFDSKGAANNKGINNAIKSLFGNKKVIKKGVSLKAPEIAENGAVVPITIKKVPSNTTTIALFQGSDPEAAIAVFTIHPRSVVKDYAVRVKLEKTGPVTVIAEANGKLYQATKTVKVTIGGCGG
jgi:sulfur-oxidizing protein SoxY